MKIRLEHTAGHDKYWEFCSIKGTNLAIVSWGPRGLFKNKQRISGRQIISIDVARRRKNEKISKGYKLVHDGKENIDKIIVPKGTSSILIYQSGNDVKFSTLKETQFDVADIEQVSSFSVDDSVTFMLPKNDRNVIKMIIDGKYLQFLEK